MPTGSPSTKRVTVERGWGKPLLLASLLIAVPTPLLAETVQHGPSEAVFIAQIILLLLCGRLFGEGMQRIGQPAIMGQLLSGVLLGPSVLGTLSPGLEHALFPPVPEQKAMIDAVAQLGVLMLLLLTGMESDLSLVRRSSRTALGVSLAGIAVPFLCGILLGEALPDSMLPDPARRLVTTLFLGTALAIASVKIVALTIRELNYLRRTIGQLIVTAAIIDDTIGWILLAIILGLAGHGTIDLASVGESVFGTLLFLAVSFTIGRRAVAWLIRSANDNLVSDLPVITTILIVMGVMALITQAIGVHTVLGAFVAGILVGQSPILTRHIDEQLRGLVVALFMPVFFSLAGLNADLSILKDPQLLGLTAGLIAIASIGKFTGAFLGGTLGGCEWRESLALACGMNARGSTEVIVASIGLSMGVISHDLFTMIVTMAVVTTFAMPPTLRWALSRLPLREEEQALLEQEEFDAKGFVPNVERLLVAVDDSANGKLALRLSGLIAASRGITTTVLNLGSGSAADVRAAIAATSKRRTDERRQRAHVTLLTGALPPDAAVTREARKGYGLLVLGMAKTLGPHGGFHEEIGRIAAMYDGPLAVVVARGPHTDAPESDALNILVPVRGNKVSRRAAEVALAMARTSDSPVTALYVLSAVGLGGAKRRLRRPTPSRRYEEAVLKEIVDLADRYGRSIRTALRLDVSPEDAILRQARLGHYNLIVMGVGRPAGDALFFGKVAAAVLENSSHSLLFVSS
jgi:Kef-type K+ transport system membrane component KefB/nucleotide-binding universal stress UspA family protein